jgi:hypothetical protein
VYGDSLFVHTLYTGTDDHFHHFLLQYGTSSTSVVVRREEAQIKPKSFSTDSGRRAFVRATRPDEIELVVLK